MPWQQPAPTFAVTNNRPFVTSSIYGFVWPHPRAFAGIRGSADRELLTEIPIATYISVS